MKKIIIILLIFLLFSIASASATNIFDTYTIDENATYWTFLKSDDTLTLPKSVIDVVHTYPDRISFEIHTTKGQIASKSIANGTGQRYIVIPKSLTNKAFIFDNKIPDVCVPVWGTCTNNSMWYSNDNGQIRFNFLTSGYTSLASSDEIIFYFNSYNVLTNSGFETGTTAGWTYYTNGVGGTLTVASPGFTGSYLGNVSVGSTVGSNNQLYQYNLGITSGYEYRVTFTANSSTGKDVHVKVQQQNSPYAVLGLDWFPNITTTPTTFTRYFVATASESNTRFYIGFNENATANEKYWFDDFYFGRTFYPPVPVISTVTTGNYWVNQSWTNGTGNVTDGYNVSINGVWANTTNNFINTSVGAGNWSNITVWGWNNSGLYLSTTNLTNNTQASDAVIDDYIPPSPTNYGYSSGNFFVNHTWEAGSGNVTDSYNVSVNGVWNNGSNATNNFSYYSPHGWSNLTVYAYNSSGTGASNSTPLTSNVQLSNNVPIMASIGNINVNEGEWLNISVNGTDADSDALTCSSNNTKGTFASCALNWSTNYADAGTYYWTFFLNDTYSGSDFETIMITINNVNQIPNVPIMDTVSTGNFWVNSSWNTGAGNITDSFNYSVNGAWTNGSTNFTNNTLSAHGWSNITVYAYNLTDNTLSATALTNNTQIPNNAPTQTAIGNQNIDEGQLLTITITSSDADGDLLTYASNNTKGNLVGNVFSWTPLYNDAGIYIWEFNTTDNYSAMVNETITVTVNNVPLNITSSYPVSPITSENGTSQTFNATSNRTADYEWFINGTSVQTNLSVLSANYTNSTAGIGFYNLTLSITDSIDTNTTQWNWTVTNASTYNLSGLIVSSTGTLLENALVSYYGGSNTSNSSGYYNLTLQNGTYNFIVSKAGYDNNITTVTINGLDLNQNFTLTLTPVTPPSGGSNNGGGGSTVTPAPTPEIIYVTNIKDMNNNPPLLEIIDTKTGAIVRLKNEGNASQEYVLSYNIRDLVFDSIIESGEQSKLIAVNETYDFNIVVKDNYALGEKYRFNAVAGYGIYHSSGTKILSNDNYTIVTYLLGNLGFLLALIMMIGIVYFYIRKLRKNQRKTHTTG